MKILRLYQYMILVSKNGRHGGTEMPFPHARVTLQYVLEGRRIELCDERRVFPLQLHQRGLQLLTLDLSVRNHTKSTWCCYFKPIQLVNDLDVRSIKLGVYNFIFLYVLRIHRYTISVYHTKLTKQALHHIYFFPYHFLYFFRSKLMIIPHPFRDRPLVSLSRSQTMLAIPKSGYNW